MGGGKEAGETLDNICKYFGCDNWGGGVLLTSGGQRPGYC